MIATRKTVDVIINGKDNASKTFGVVNKASGSLATGLGSLTSKALLATTAVAAVGTALVGKFLKDSIVSGAQLEKTKIGFETMFGSAETAGKVLKELTDFAKITPFDLPGVQESAQQLIAVGAATKDNLIPTLKAVGDVTAGVNGDLDRVILNFGQVATQGKLTGRELRDFAVQGIPIISELAKNLNVSEQAIADMVSESQIGFDDVKKAFETMSGEGGKFENLMQKQSKSLGGLWENLKDSLGILGRAIVGLDTEGNLRPGGLFDTAKTIMESFLNVVNDNQEKIIEFVDTIQNFLSPILKGLAEDWRENEGVMGIVKTAIETINQIIRDSLEDWNSYEGFIGKVREAIDDAAAVIQQGIDDWNGYHGAVGMVRRIIEDLIDVYQNRFKKAWNDLLKAIEPHLPKLKEFAKIAGGVLLASIVGVILVVGELTVFVIKLATFVAKAETAINNFKKNAIDKITKAFMDWLVWINNVNQKFESFKATISSLVPIIKDTLATIVNDFRQKGAEVIDGFIGGIKSKIGAVTEAISGVANSVKNVFSNALQIKSPSKVFKGYGKNLIEGLVLGVDEGDSDIQTKLTKTVDDINALMREKLSAGKDRRKEITKDLFDLRETKKNLEEDLKLVDEEFKKSTERLEEFGDAFKALDKKSSEAIENFSDKLKTARTDFKDFKDSIKADIKEENLAFATSNEERQKGLAESIAKEIVNMDDRKSTLLKQLEEEKAKGKDASAKKIAELEGELKTVDDLLRKHGSDRITFSNEIAELEKFNAMSPIEQLRERFRLEQQESNIAHNDRINGLKDSLKEEQKAVIENMKKIRKRRKKVLKGIKKDYKETFNDLQEFIINNKGGSTLATESSGGMTDFQKLVSVIQEFINKPLGVQAFANGGVVKGSGGTDSVPAMLTPGEIVLPPGVKPVQQTVEINFNNATVRNDGDLNMIISAVKRSIDRDTQLSKIGI